MIRKTLAELGLDTPIYNDGIRTGTVKADKTGSQRRVFDDRMRRQSRRARKRANRAIRDLQSTINTIKAERESRERFGPYGTGFSQANGKKQRGLYHGMNRDTTGKSGVHITTLK
jgi:hypothetical protein